MKTIEVGANDFGQRIDKFLIKYFKNLPASFIYKAIRKNRIKVNGKKVKQDYKLLENDSIDMYINDEMFLEVKPNEAFLVIKNPVLDIVYEDDNIVIINKRAGLLVHSDDNEQVNTLISTLQSYLYQKGEYQPEAENSFAPSLCNRIDRNTQGIVIAAKNASALREINEKIKTKEIKKFYLCVVTGILGKKQDELSGYLIKNKSLNKVFIADTKNNDARSITTRYRVLAERSDLSLLEVELVTGRTHQIRAHFASIGHALLGDGKYGKLDREHGIKYQALCSYKVKFAFGAPPQTLQYLDGKEFEIPKEQIDFLKLFN